MKVAYVTAGGAGMYCGSCMRDNTLAAALHRSGVDITLIPTFTPIRTDEEDVSVDRVFLGGINVYLEERSALFRRLPKFVRRTLDSPRLLRGLSKLALQTRRSEDGAIARSLLRGEDGPHAAEIRDLVDFLANDIRPDVVNLTNLLIAGFVPALKRRADVPVFVTLQGDDVFLDALEPRDREDVLAGMRRIARGIDGFVVFNAYSRDAMAELFEIPEDRFHIVPLGLSTAETFADPGFDAPGSETGEGTAGPRAGRRSVEPLADTDDRSASHPRDDAAGSEPDGTFARPRPRTVGYLARIGPEKGFHVLVDAFLELRTMPGMEDVRLRAAGWLGPADRPFFERERRRLEEAGALDAFEHVDVPEREDKIRLLRSLDAFSVPTVYREPKGIYVLEALAAGVPVVQPAHGSFPELLEQTGGGVLVPPEDPSALARALCDLLSDDARRRALGDEGRRGVLAHHRDEHMAQRTLDVWRGAAGDD